MGYHVEFVDPVRVYLEQVAGLSDTDRAAVVDGVLDELGRDADRFLALYPLAHESLCFRYDFAFRPKRRCIASILSLTPPAWRWEWCGCLCRVYPDAAVLIVFGN